MNAGASCFDGSAATPLMFGSLITIETCLKEMTDETDEDPFHPGEMLLEEFIKPGRWTQTELAKQLGLDESPLKRVD